MSLAEAFKNYQPRAKGLLCQVCRMMADLSASDRKALDAAFADTDLSAPDILYVLTEAGQIPESRLPSVGSLNRHRRGECKGIVP